MREYIDEDGVLLTREEYKAGLGRGRVRTRLVEFEPSIVDESQRSDTDLNVLVKRWMRGEPVPQFEAARFADVSEVPSYQEMQERLLVVERMFGQLPAFMREHFRNSPAEFADAMVDPSRVDELVELGLLEKVPPKEAPVGGTPEGEPERRPGGAGSGDAGASRDPS